LKYEFSSRFQHDLIKLILDVRDSKNFLESLSYMIKKINDNKFATDKEANEKPPGMINNNYIIYMIYYIWYLYI